MDIRKRSYLQEGSGHIGNGGINIIWHACEVSRMEHVICDLRRNNLIVVFLHAGNDENGRDFAAIS